VIEIPFGQRQKSMMAKPQNTFKGLHGIRDMALLLGIANVYLCEEEFLQEAGVTIGNHLDELRVDISSLKEKFPGQFVKEADTDQLIDNIQQIVQRLKEPDKDIQKKCRIGALGLELENGINVIGHTIDTIRSQVEGELGIYSKTESVLASVGWIKSLGRKIIGLSALTVKLAGVVVLILAVVFTSLFLSMDSQEDLLKEVHQCRDHVGEHLKILSNADAEKERINKELDIMNENELTRADKTRMIELNLEIHKINERVYAAQAEIDAYQKRIDEMEKRIEELNQKSFLKRLFRL
jgi:hypothetical protein